jgi:hypothetical protein
VTSSVFSSDISNPAFVDPTIDSRSISFENPTGARGAGGTARNGRKGSPFRIIDPGERVVLADLRGPGTIRHIWMAIELLWSPAVYRSLRFEVHYDDLAEPSVSVPLLDFFGMPHGRFAEIASELIAIHKGRGINSYIPIPFDRAIRIELTNESERHVALFLQLDYTLEPSRSATEGYLHATFRRENPTTLGRDFVIADGFRGPGRFLGCVVGVRTVDPASWWYGEGEVKIYRDGDDEFPTYCGTGLEDYVGCAWGMEQYTTPYSGVPLDLHPEGDDESSFVSFYRWHLPDPVMFSDEVRVTIQQIGGGPGFVVGQEAEMAAHHAERPPAGAGLLTDVTLSPDSLGFAIEERVDDYCATAYVYLREPQPVPRYSTAIATADIDRTSADAPPSTSEEDYDAFNVAMSRRWGPTSE